MKLRKDFGGLGKCCGDRLLRGERRDSTTVSRAPLPVSIPG